MWHAGLPAKLHAAGITGKIHAWFADYLSDRKQRVVLPGAVSDWTYIRAGVPQGSILGPLLFLLYINDIVNDIGSNIRLFADDTSLFIIVDDPVTAAGCIKADLGKISAWASTWLVTFNPSKTETLLVSRKLNRLPHPPVFMQNHQIYEVESHKHLGLYFSNDCTWHQHIKYMPGRVAQSVGHLTRKSGVLGSIPGLATYFRFSFRFFKKGSCQLLAKVCARSTG